MQLKGHDFRAEVTAMPKIFISYRQKDIRGDSRHLYKRLAESLGEKTLDSTFHSTVSLSHRSTRNARPRDFDRRYPS